MYARICEGIDVGDGLARWPYRTVHRDGVRNGFLLDSGFVEGDKDDDHRRVDSLQMVISM